MKGHGSIEPVRQALRLDHPAEGSMDAVAAGETGFDVMPCPWSACFKPAFNLATFACNDCQAAKVASKSLQRSE